MNVFTRLQSRRPEGVSQAAVEIVAPLSGLLVKLEAAPDEAFAGALLGDGIAIDPTSATLRAPCDGEVISIAAARHAATVRAANGAEILMHIGVETVALGGEGFKARVRVGARVKAGDALIDFDMDVAARKARSLVSPVIVVNGDEYAITRRAEGEEIGAGDFLFAVARRSEAAPDVVDRGGEARGAAVIQLAHGIHARPAAEIVARAKSFSATVQISFGAKTANARSLSALMGLGAKHRDEASILAKGKDAAAAVASIRDYLAAGSIESGAPASPDALAPPAVAAITGPATFAGVTASPGVAIGVAHVIALAVAAIDETGKGVAYERAQLDAALAAVGGRLKAEIAKGAAPYTDILQAHADLLDDPELVAKAASQIAAGKSAGRAWRAVMREQAEILGAMEDARMAERAADFVDLERQVLAMLRGDESGDALPENAVLIADEIYPSQLLRLDRARLAGIATARGGPTSHASILASSMGIPAIVALGPAVLGAAPGSTVIVDADKARVHVAPGDGVVAETRATQGRKRALRARALAAGAEDCRTADGARIEALANLASSAEAEIAAGNFAEGCGLLRTEFLFLNRSTPPSEAEQTAEYQAIADALGNRPLVVRTLDVGADKSVPYIPLAKEENPALGLRGVRASLARPDLLEAQLRAILAVRPAGRCRIMLPMITSLAELRAVRAVLARHESDRPAALGVMIETPAAAVLADQLAAEADFLSIGTNDLAQYVLAMDRGNARLAAGIDALAPAVLRFIAMTGEAGARSGAPVGVCGGLASDFVAAPLLIGLGVGALSGAASRIPELKAFIRTLRKSECETAARRALELEDSAAVRAFARQTWPQLDEWT